MSALIPRLGSWMRWVCVCVVLGGLAAPGASRAIADSTIKPEDGDVARLRPTPLFRGCLRRAQRALPEGLRGRARVHVVIDPRGAVAQVTASSPTLPPWLLRCFEDAVRRMRFSAATDAAPREFLAPVVVEVPPREPR